MWPALATISSNMDLVDVNTVDDPGLIELNPPSNPIHSVVPLPLFAISLSSLPLNIKS